MTIRHSAVAYPYGEAPNTFVIQAWLNDLLGKDDPEHPGWHFVGVHTLAIASDHDGATVLAMAVMEIAPHAVDTGVDEIVQTTTTYRRTPKLQDKDGN